MSNYRICLIIEVLSKYKLYHKHYMRPPLVNFSKNLIHTTRKTYHCQPLILISNGNENFLMGYELLVSVTELY